MVCLPLLRSRPVILLFGDSITQQGFGLAGTDGTTAGWASLLARDYARRADVLNRGYSGYNTDHALQVLPSIVGDDPSSQRTTTTDVLFATVFFGANDAALPGETQRVPKERYGRNLTAIVEHMRSTTQREVDTESYEECEGNNQTRYNSVNQRGDSLEPQHQEQFPVILLTPPPVDVEIWYRLRPSRQGVEWNDRANANAKSYGEEVKRVGKETRCSVLDVFELLGGDNTDPEVGCRRHLRDGLHLSESGNLRVYEGLMGLLEREHPHLLPMMDKGLGGKCGKKTAGVPLDGKPWREFRDP